MGVSTKVETITPEIAKEYLAHNTDNFRKLSRRTVRKYANDILHGKWELNGETIVFDENGVLKNGQHRLAAILMAKKPMQVIVVRGIKSEVTIYDMNNRRTDTDIAKARGIDADSTMIAVANIVVNKFSGRKGGTDVVDYVEAHYDELLRATRITGKGGKNSPSICATYLMLRTRTMPSYEIELFFRLMYDFSLTFADGYEVSPAIVAQRMFDERGSKQSGYQIQKERLEILVMALEDFHKGKKRENKYKIQEPFNFLPLLNKVRKEDGLEG